MMPLRVLPLVALAACIDAAIGPLSAEIAEDMPTVVHVTWTSETPSVGRVEGDGVLEAPADAAPTTRHDIRVLGLREDTVYTLRVTEDDAPVGEVEVRTGSLDADIPDFEVATPVEGMDEVAYVLVSALSFEADGSTTSFVAVLDREGYPVWGVSVPELFPMFPTFDPEKGVRALQTDIDDYAMSRLDVWDLDGVVATEPMPDAHHEAVWLPDGTLAYCVTETREIGGELVAGDVLLERAPDGTVTRVWDAFDALPVTRNDGWDETKLADGAADWTHVNGLAWSQKDDAWLLSLFYPETIVQVDRATGETAWVLGGAESSFAQDEGAAFGPQHAPLLTDEGLLVFDNSGAGPGSRLAMVSLDEVGARSSLVWDWRPPTQDWSLMLGHAAPAGDGLVVSWGLAPDVYLLDAEHREAGHLRLDREAFSGALGAAVPLASLYR